MIKPEFSSKDVQVTKQEALYSGHLNLLKYHFRFRLFKGGWSDEVIRECFLAKPAVGVLLFNPEKDEVILIEQFRPGAYSPSQQHSPWLLELVAGLIETDESIEEVAKRESMEEAGCEILDLIPIGEFFTSPGVSTGYFHLFCARINQQHMGGIFGLDHEHEDIRAHVVSKQDALQLLQSGQIKNAPTIIALQWLQLNEQRIQSLWK
jgi:ADP-ribose pyrophosphatase